MSELKEIESSMVRTLSAKDMRVGRYLVTAKTIEDHKKVQRPVAVIIPYDQYCLMLRGEKV